jgi:hypothetical protein
LPLNYQSELCTVKNKIKIFEGVSKSKNMVFNVKKLLNIAVALTLWQRGEKKPPRRNEQQILRI